MAPKKKGKASAVPGTDDPRTKLLWRWAAAPTAFFGVEVEGARYLARVIAKHATQSLMVWLKFKSDGKQVSIPHDLVTKWLITADEADAGDWYSGDEESSEDDAVANPAAAAKAGTSGSGSGSGKQPAAPAADGPRGSIKSGRWEPAQNKSLPHASDGFTWRPLTAGNAAQYKPTASAVLAVATAERLAAAVVAVRQMPRR